MRKIKTLNTNPAGFMLAGFLIIILFFGGLAGWSFFFPFEGAIIANGLVQVYGEKQVVQHLEGGIIDEIYVMEGDRVLQGDLLIKLQNPEVYSNVELLQGRLWSKLAESARLDAEIAMAEKIDWPEELLSLQQDAALEYEYNHDDILVESLSDDAPHPFSKDDNMVDAVDEAAADTLLKEDDVTLNPSASGTPLKQSVKTMTKALISQNAYDLLPTAHKEPFVSVPEKPLPTLPSNTVQKKRGGASQINKILLQEEDIFVSGRAALQGQIDLNLSQIEQLRSRIRGIKEQLSTESKIISNLSEELGAKRALAKGKYLDKSAILTLERELYRHKGTHGSLKQSVPEYLQRIEELKLQNVNFKNQYRERAVTQLVEIRDTIFQIREQLKPLMDTVKRLAIRAPISGVIFNMQVNSEKSGVIRPGMPLLEIVPKDSALIISAQVSPHNITKVKKGQPAKVALSAFDRRTTPPLPGEVTYLSSDLVTQSPFGEVRPYYEVHVNVTAR